ncbi:hypothetical protein [Acidipropionibacterium timonense]|uniref:hypothetical protein n=1 Tax=Acidipropionibacterium timonense TaxID=2161818 RepID=UPI00102F59EF|nr:hypothetical protein [Acidipropionibacterium timonense]
MGLLRRRGPGDEVMTVVRDVLEHPGVRALAWGRGRTDRPVTAVATEDGLVVVPEDGAAGAVAWHEVIRGGWRKEESTLWWTLLDHSRVDVVLEDPGRLPEVFDERVTASIVCQDSVGVPGGRAVVAGRRRAGRLGREDPSILWTVVALGDADLTDPQTERLVLERSATLKAQWEAS